MELRRAIGARRPHPLQPRCGLGADVRRARRFTRSGRGPEIVTPPRFVVGQLLIGFAPALDEEARDRLIGAHGGETVARLDRLAARVIAVRRDRPLGEIARGFAEVPGVRYVEPNAVQQTSTAPSAPSDPRYAEQWALAKINAADAWATSTGDSEVVVGVIDSGVDYDHPDLAANIWVVPTGQTIGGCGEGTRGYSSIADVESCDPTDDLGSGTQVAGTIGAVGDNGIGIAGINWRVKIMALKCVDANGFLQISDAVRVIDYAIAAKEAGIGLRVLSIGWTTTTPSETLHAAIAEAGAAGILVVAAAGDRSNDNDTSPNYPASFAVSPYNLKNVISTAVIGPGDAPVSSYSYGLRSVQMAAPGVGVRTTTVDGSGYELGSGSALAAGYVSGTAALILAAEKLSPPSLADLRSRLLYCGDPVPGLAEMTVTGRRLNAARALANIDCDFTLTTITSPFQGGRIEVSPGVNSYRSGTIVSLTAFPTEGYTFVGWQVGEQSRGTLNPLKLTMGADRTVTAVFAKPTFTLSTQANGGGTIGVSPTGGIYAAGTSVSLTATADPGYRFTGWLVDGNSRGINVPLVLTMNANYRVAANFVLDGPASPDPSLIYPLALSATAGGTAAAVPGVGPYAPNTRVTLSATPASGYVFTGWTIDGVAAGLANPYTLTMTAARSAVANFAPAHTLNLSYTSGGRVVASAATWAGDSPYPVGTVVTLEAITASNGVFTGWTIDGVFQGWATPLTLTMDGPHSVVATFTGRPRFGDLPPGPPPYEAITQLAARGIVRGYEDGDFGPNDTTLRAQMAALIVRALGWEGENQPNPFSDRNGVDDGLWRSVATLAAYDVARGYGDGTYGTLDPVLQIQTIAFITRAMVREGRWVAQSDNPALFPAIPDSSGHREDLATFVHYAGAPPGTALGGNWATWDIASSRAWFATALWQALDSYYNADRTP
ncbi:MAG TPA: S8 family serine peptidase [Thermomicrobiales bacterium]|jgi:subtilisin family serine protease